MNFGHAAMMFLLAGVVPGTSIVLSGEQMLQLFSGLAGFMCARGITQMVSHSINRQTVPHSQPKAAVLAK